MRREGGWEAGKFLLMVSDRGDQCLFRFLMLSSFFSSTNFRFRIPIAY
jgi:hypothetical protein